eukprot:7168500-Prymnesium_polylepis.1
MAAWLPVVVTWHSEIVWSVRSAGPIHTGARGMFGSRCSRRCRHYRRRRRPLRVHLPTHDSSTFALSRNSR